MRKMGIVLVLVAAAAAQDVEELTKLAPSFDTSTGEAPASFRVEACVAFGIVRVAWDDRHDSLVVWNPLDGCPLLVTCGRRAVLYDVRTGTLQVMEGAALEFQLHQDEEQLNLAFWIAEESDSLGFEAKVDVGSILARCRPLQAVDLGDGTWKLTGRSERRNLLAAWIDPKATPAFRRVALIMRAAVSFEREAKRVEIAFGEAAPGDFPEIPDPATLAKAFTVERVRGLGDERVRRELMARIVNSCVLAAGVVRTGKRAEVEAAFASPVDWEKLEKPYARARKALIARFGRGPLAGHYERAKDAFDADRFAEARPGFELALKDGDTRALMYLGMLAWHLDKDTDRARKYLRRSAEDEFADGQFALGSIVQEDDPKEAAAWFRRAAESGQVGAACRLGYAYREGLGVSKDPHEAARWFTVAADAGQAEAQYALAQLLFKGNGVEKDYAAATRWYERAAEQGHAEAQLMLGVCYVMGLGVPEDAAKAAFRFRQAAEQGNAPAQRFLGRAYAVGNGVEEDPAQAVKWLEAAAKQGLAEACVDLAGMYDEGKGVAQNAARAHAFYVLGGKPDDAARLAKDMTPEELQESKRLQLSFRRQK